MPERDTQTHDNASYTKASNLGRHIASHLSFGATTLALFEKIEELPLRIAALDAAHRIAEYNRDAPASAGYLLAQYEAKFISQTAAEGYVEDRTVNAYVAAVGRAFGALTPGVDAAKVESVLQQVAETGRSSIPIRPHTLLSAIQAVPEFSSRHRALTHTLETGQYILPVSQWLGEQPVDFVQQIAQLNTGAAQFKERSDKAQAALI